MLTLAVALSLQAVLWQPAAPAATETPWEWSQLPPLPDKVGFGGMFAGVAGDVLIAAGGANFPDKPLAEGGSKVWHDEIYVLENPEGPWRNAAEKLPRPMAYGAAVSYRDRTIFLGGGDAKQHYADVLEVRWNQGKLAFMSLPKLPKPCTGHGAAIVGEMLYVAGGIEAPEGRGPALHTFWALDLSRPAGEQKWQELEPWPGPERHQAVPAVHDGAFYLFGGLQMKSKPDGGTERATPFLRDAYRYRAGRWEKLAELPRGVTAAPSPATAVGGQILICGGIDTLPSFPFPTSILAYDPQQDRWLTRGVLPEGASRVTAPTVAWRGRMVVVSGESGPGLRSPSVWQAQPRGAKP